MGVVRRDQTGLRMMCILPARQCCAMDGDDVLAASFDKGSARARVADAVGVQCHCNATLWFHFAEQCQLHACPDPHDRIPGSSATLLAARCWHRHEHPPAVCAGGVQRQI